MISARPLDRFPLINTSNLDEALAARSRMYATPKVEFVGRQKALRAIVNLCELQHIRISYGSYSAGLHMQFPETSFATHIFLLRGESEIALGQRSEMITPDRAVVISPNEAFGVTHKSDYDRLVLSANSRSLASALSAITGKSFLKPLKFNPVQEYSLPGAKACAIIFYFLSRS